MNINTEPAWRHWSQNKLGHENLQCSPEPFSHFLAALMFFAVDGFSSNTNFIRSYKNAKPSSRRVFAAHICTKILLPLKPYITSRHYEIIWSNNIVMMRPELVEELIYIFSHNYLLTPQSIVIVEHTNAFSGFSFQTWEKQFLRGKKRIS
jgi:hypothetical protein